MTIPKVLILLAALCCAMAALSAAGIANLNIVALAFAAATLYLLAKAA